MNISFSEIAVVFLVALLLFGPEQLPIIARQLGKLAAEFRKGTNAIRREFYNSVYQPAQEVRHDLQAHGRQLRALRTEVLTPNSLPAAPVSTPIQSKDVNALGPADPSNNASSLKANGEPS